MPFAPIRRRCLSLLVLAALSACAGAPPSPTLFDTAVAPGYNGVVLARAGRGGAPLVKAYGKAQFESAAALTPDARFMIGSVSKWITAVTVLRLADQGKLALDEPITSWLPELPGASRAVTLRALLSNTSGIENGLGLTMKRDRSPERSTISATEAALKFGNGPLMFAPGAKFDYSVTNWLLVAGVVERATGEPFTRSVTRLVFEAAGVRDTGFANGDYTALPRMAIAYSAEKTTRKTPPAPAMAAASGTIYSTARDLVKIADAVYGGTLLSPASRRELSSVQYAPEEYALGGRVKQHGGRMLAWETGVSGGYKTLLAYAPQDGRAVVLLNNTDMAQSEQARIGLALLAGLEK